MTATARVTNYCQVSYKTVVVSGTQDAVNKAGRKKEIVYQLVKKNKEIRRDIEFDITNNQAPNAGNSTTARALRPMLSFYSTNVDAGSGGANGTTSAARTDSSSQRALTEQMVKNGIQNAWTQGGDVDLIMCGPYNKTVISTFTGNNTRMQDTSDGKLSAALSVYESDFGTHKIVPNRFSRERDVHLLTTDLWAVANLRPMQAVDLAKTGDAEKGMVVCEYTIEARNQKGSALIADLTTNA